MSYRITTIYLLACVLLISCSSISDKNETNKQDVNPYVYEMPFTDSPTGETARNAFFSNKLSSLNYKVVLPQDEMRSKDKWMEVLKETQPYIDQMNRIYHDISKIPVEKHTEISKQLNNLNNINANQRAILEQVAACRLLPLLNESDKDFPEVTALYLEKLWKYKNTSFDLQINTLEKLKGTWSSEKLNTTKQKLLDLAKAQISEGKSYMANHSNTESNQGFSKLSVSLNEVKSKVAHLEKIVAELESWEIIIKNTWFAGF